ncbi:hypothetical protein BGX38DRAFT_1159775 [Terfezia claveryi]|nr:hypothetical protein BGX38DRAFT_1159775 [Terfezia claveryi]
MTFTFSNPFRKNLAREGTISRPIIQPLPEIPSSPPVYSTDEEERRRQSVFREVKLTPGLLPYDDVTQGSPLRTHHFQCYLSISWLFFLIAFVCLLEYAAWAHSLPSDRTRDWMDWRAFGRQGTPWRKGVVNGLSVTRTVLAILHVPIMTAVLSSTLPPLTQRLEGRVPPHKLTAAQLFLLADRSWSGAGGWISAMKVGNLPWVWWRLTLLAMTAFLGFPLITVGYYTTAEQFWHSIEYDGVSTWELRNSTSQAIEGLTPEIKGWMHSRPQRSLGNLRLYDGGWYKAVWGRMRGYTDMQTINLRENLSFFPPAYDISPLGHFVSSTPQDREGLIVANTLGFIQTLQCQPMQAGKEPTLLDLSRPQWGCKINCSAVNDKSLCHTRTSLGKRNGQHVSQVASCALANNVTSQDGVTISTEIALKINPDYQASGMGLPFANNATPPYSFKSGDKLSGTEYYVEVINCTMGYIPGYGVVDSIVRKFMHFTPLVVRGAPRPLPGELPQLTPVVEEKLWHHLELLLNVTATLPLNFLHEYFLESNYAKDRNDYNSSLPIWFGVQHPGDPKEQLTKSTSERAPSSKDRYLIDNMVRVNSTVFKNSLIGLVNSTLIEQLGSFFNHAKQYGFIYETDVKIYRGPMPLRFVPIILLFPVCVVVFMSLRLWNTPTWTAYLDSWAMFKLGRDWGRDTTGQGAVELRDSWQAMRIPGYVGDGKQPMEKRKDSVEVNTKGGAKKGLGYLQLGGKGPLKVGTIYT